MKRLFGNFNGQEVYEYTIENKEGLRLSALNYGGIVTRLEVPDRDGRLANVVLGFDTFEEYLDHSPYFGAIVGRVAGRIRGGSFTLDGKRFELTKNAGEHQVHGGRPNFSKSIFTVTEQDQALVFSYRSRAFENGYPGELLAEIRYTLTDSNEWVMEYKAETDAATLYNPTNHTYFNLANGEAELVLDHQLQLRSAAYAPIDAEGIPTGEIRAVEGTAFDFRKAKQIEEAITAQDEQILAASGGLDHGFILEHKAGEADAILFEPNSGRGIKMTTTAPAVVIYTANTFPGNYFARNKKAVPYSGITFETQVLPDAIHQANFGNTVLRPGETFHSKTSFGFFTQ
ncbi:aldose 1-epimerase [Listeria floridensis FSL S10-1187]|uniref:Aldose 1-epimerase n=1 Tax=Listeria floridensis FSL S10-1187 TaxID=1265817 RepID=A0ABN0RBR5_9LIST|nr:aldose epimerase family protein [Listeria floridensis]EUJ25605.1 aldose 1-epimerase [Listeria floridensis FSL S10-1187]